MNTNEEIINYLRERFRVYEMMSPKELYGNRNNLYHYIHILNRIMKRGGDINQERYSEAYKIFFSKE